MLWEVMCVCKSWDEDYVLDSILFYVLLLYLILFLLFILFLLYFFHFYF